MANPFRRSVPLREPAAFRTRRIRRPRWRFSPAQDGPESLERRLCLSTIQFVGTELIYRASTGISNALTVSLEGDTYTLYDLNDKITDVINKPNGCRVRGISGGTQIRPVTVECDTSLIELITLDLQDLNDSTVVQSARDAVVIQGGTGDDTMLISAVNRLTAPLTVDGGAGSNSLTLDDSADILPNRVTVTASTVGAASDDTFFGTGGRLASYTNLNELHLSLGSGSDYVAVTGTRADITGIRTGDGNDRIDLGNSVDALDDIQGRVRIDAGLGSDTVQIRDSGQTADESYELSNDSFTKTTSKPVAIDYAAVEAIDLATGSGHDAVAIQAYGVDLPTLIDVRTGRGDDSFTINLAPPSVAALLRLDGGDDRDDLTVNAGDLPDQITVADVIVVGTTTIDPARIEGLVISGGEGADVIDVSKSAVGVTIYAGDGDDVVTSGSGDDIIFGGGGNDIINGGAGNDLINTGDGNDVIFGGGGNDIINGGAGNDLINTGDGNDVIFGGEGNDVVDGGDGDDQIITDDGDDIIFGGSGNDIVNGGRGNDLINTGDGNDVIFGGGGNDVVNGGRGNDLINTGDGNDIIFGGDGDDFVDGGSGDDEVDAGDGDDIIFGGGGNDLVNGGAGNDLINTGDGNDVIFGAAGNDLVNGGAGNDLINTGDGNDIIFGGDGDDSISTGRGDDLLFAGEGNDLLDGGEGDDVYIFQGDNLGTDQVIEPPNRDTDTLDFSALSGAVTIDLASLALQTIHPGILQLQFVDPWNPSAVEFTGVENVVGTEFADEILGNSRDNRLLGADLFSFPPTTLPPILNSPIQWVLLDFDSETQAGDWNYSPTERDAIEARIAADYAAFNFAFTQDADRIPTTEFATLFFNKLGDLNEAGQADEVDFRNLNLGGTASIDVNIILGGENEPQLTSDNVVAASATIAAHELGHLVGLRHADSFGPIGFGIHDPPGSEGFLPTYPGRVDAFETVQHLMASPSSVGSTLDDAVANPFFSERSAIKLAFAESGVVLNEAPGFHGSPATAQPIQLSGLFVPNTLRAGLNQVKQFAVEALTVVGTIDLQPSEGVSESDVYAFRGQGGDVFTFEVISRVLDRIRAPIDPVVRVLDEAGDVLAFYDGIAENDDSFEPADSLLVDFRIPHDGLYYVEVDTFTFVGRPDFETFCGPEGPFQGSDACFDIDTGQYELFLYRFDTGNATDLDDVLIGRDGNDTLEGGFGNDQLVGGRGDNRLSGDQGDDTYVVVPNSSDQAIERYVVSGGTDTLDFSGATRGITIDLGQDDGTPQIVDSALRQVSLHGTFENVIGSSFDDLLIGNSLGNEMNGLAGDDVLVGGMGNDTLTGFTGVDSLDGGPGVDTVVEVRNSNMKLSDASLSIGAEGNDSLASIEIARLTGGADANNLNASPFTGTAILYGLGGDDDLSGGAGDDILDGGDGDDRALGSSGNDILLGGAGHDSLVGGSGRDLLIGGADVDRLVGGADDDILIGGATVYDALEPALRAILAEWTSSDGYLSRVRRLREGIPAPAGLPMDLVQLNGAAVLDDQAVDDLTGSSDEDWFLLFASVDITDRKPGEAID